MRTALWLIAVGLILAPWHAARAQEPLEQPAVAQPQAEQRDEGIEANNAATQARLARRLTADFVEVPLEEAILSIGELTGVETYINRRSLEALGLGVDSPVTVQLKRVRADMLLDLILQQAGEGEIDYLIRDGILVITSVASIDGGSDVKAYRVADLLKLHGEETPADAPGASGPLAGGPFGGGISGVGPVCVGGSSLPPAAESLVQVIRNTVAPESWSEAGGHGTITYYGEMLIVRQNARTHREIEKVLALLRETAKERDQKAD